MMPDALSSGLPVMVPAAPLQSLNTLAVPARADLLAQVDTLEQLQALLQWRRQHADVRNLPVVPLGGGSNIVLAGDVHGLVVRLNILGREIVAEDADYVWVKVGAGENWHSFVSFCMSFHYWGLENLALIPGSVGAAPIQNIGAYGVEVRDCFAELSAVDIDSGVSVTFDRDACHFGYRDSVFKQQLKDRYIITSVTFRLHKTPKIVCEYPALRQYLQQASSEVVTPQQIFAAVCAIRREKLPDPAEIPNVGSFFKNPLISRAQFTALEQQYPDIVGYPQADGQVKLAAGWLIDRAGWRGYVQGPVGVHRQQALVLVNHSQGSGADILTLAAAIQADIKHKYDVMLEVEPRIYGAD